MVVRLKLQTISSKYVNIISTYKKLSLSVVFWHGLFWKTWILEYESMKYLDIRLLTKPFEERTLTASKIQVNFIIKTKKIFKRATSHQGKIPREESFNILLEVFGIYKEIHRVFFGKSFYFIMDFKGKTFVESAFYKLEENICSFNMDIH